MAALGVLAVLGGAGAALAEPPLTPGDVMPRERYDGPMPTREALTRPDGVDAYRDAARGIAAGSARRMFDSLRDEAARMGVEAPRQTSIPQGERALPHPYRATIMVSRAMGETALADLAARLGGREDVRLAFRGVPPGMSVPQFAFWLSKLQGEAGVATVIDPELFEITGTEAVPAMVLEDTSRPGPERGSETGEIVAEAVGFFDPDWLYDRYRAGDTRPASRNVYEIVEEDLRDRARREARAVMARLGADSEARVNRYWAERRRELDGAPIGPAPQDATRELSFLFRAEEPIRDAQGKVLAYPGEIYDARDVRPFDRRIVVFDPNRPAEMAYVADVLSREAPGVSRTLLVAAALPDAGPEERPWAGLQGLVDRFERKVFLLNPQMQRTFRIRHTPTLVRPRPVQGGPDAVIAIETRLED